MKTTTKGLGVGIIGKRGARKAAIIVLAAGLGLSLASGAVQAGEHHHFDGRHGAISGSYEFKLYGTVEKTPQDLIGTWVVRGRQIVVTRDTRIDEEHGRAGTGAYVEVEGTVVNNTLTAYKIDVKRGR